MVTLVGLLACHYGALILAPGDATRCAAGALTTRPVAAAAPAEPPLLARLKPGDRARVLAALAGLIILGFALVLAAWWGARFTRRYLKRPWPGRQPGQRATISEFDWAEKRLYDPPDSRHEPRGAQQPTDREEPPDDA